MKDKIDSYHYHEFIDRCDTIRTMIEELLSNHPVCNEDIINDIDIIQILLGELYNKVNTMKVISNKENITLFDEAIKMKNNICNEIHNKVYSSK